ncbi:MAG TPA: T9SS type A sorting domain-containing protein [Ignavibacteriales bacterium]|nr:T9SS type A sorting domain-containing protein [Ignavibacteriales bacterium]
MKAVILLMCVLFTFSVSQAQYTNVKINKTNNQPEEVAIAINPANPLNIAAGANINNYYYSFDSGKSWMEGRLSSPYGVWGDPSLTFDAAGNLYYAHLSAPPESLGYWIDRMVVQKSADGGISWSPGIGVGFNPPRRNQDKEWISSDWTQSKFRNNIYLSWTQFDRYGSTLPTDSSRIMFSRSSDGGENWSLPVVISDSSGDCRDSSNTVEGAVPAVGPEGEIYISWASPSGIKFDKSLDGGVTFGRDIYAASQPGGWDFDIRGIDRCNGMPVTVCDISNSPYRGNIYINWSDQRNGYGNTDVFITRSTDGGISWSKAMKVNGNISSDRDQFFTWATIDPVRGHIWVVYYDRSTTQGTATDVFISKSTDGGETFSTFKVSESSFTPDSSVFFGDYTNIAAYDGKVYPIWMRMDGKVLSIFTALIDEGPVGVESQGRLMPGKFFLYQNYPNPFNSSTTIDYSLSVAGMVRLTVYDTLGKVVSVISDEFQEAGMHSAKFDAGSLPSGLYSFRLQKDGFTSSGKMLLLK